MRAQSVSSAPCGPRVAGGDRGLQGVRARRPPERLGALERREAAADQQLIPARAVLIEQQDRLARRADARPERDAWISISATRPWTSGSRGTSSARMRPEPQRVLAQSRAASSRRRRSPSSPR